VYGRQYADQVLRFEPSGGLLHNSLILQDKETDSYWSLMKGSAIAGDLFETRLHELPVGEKVIWREWVEKHPDTLVLSVKGREDVPVDPYREYYASDRGFGDRVARDSRLPTKEPIFAFLLDGASYAVLLSALEGGTILSIGDREVFLFRPVGSPVLRSTVAYLASSGGFERVDEGWRHTPSMNIFDEGAGVFQVPVEGLTRMQGFDTYWYTWSPQNPGTRILGR